MPTTETTNSSLVIEGELSPDTQARVDAYEKEIADAAASAPPVETTETPTDTGAAEQDASVVDTTAFQEYIKEKGLDEDAFADKLFRDRKFKIKVNGKEKEMDYGDIKSHLSRETTFQKKYNQLETSDEYRLGMLMAAATAGDKAAIKQVKEQLVKAMGSSDDDDFLDKLSEVEGEYNAEAELEKRKESTKFDDAFMDVKDEVDYEDNIDIINSVLKGFIPPKIFEVYWENPADRRNMYDLAASGQLEGLLAQFQADLSELSYEKRLEVKSDPDLYSAAFLDSVNRMANNATAEQPKPESSGDDGLSSVSSGTRGKQKPTEPQVPDFLTMTSDEFAEYKRKNGLI